MRQAFTRVLALCLCLTAAPVVAHAQAPAAPQAVVRINEGLVKELVKANKSAKPIDAAVSKVTADALVASAGVPCTVTAVSDFGEAKMTVDKVSGQGKAVEVACANDVGYIITQHGATKAYATDCVFTSGMDAAVFCKLPANTPPAKTLQPLLLNAKSACVAQDARYYGEGATSLAYEVKCASGTGVVLQVAQPRVANPKATAFACLALPVGQTPCKLTTPEQNMAPIRALVTKSTPGCKIAKERYAVGLADGSDYYEFACEDKKGFLIQANSAGELVKTLDCARATAMGLTCTFTDAKAVLAALQADYATKVSGLGVKCALDKFNPLPTKPDGTEAVEYQCKGAPGGVMLTPKDGNGFVVNCGRSLAEGYSCTLTPKDVGYSSVTAQLVAKGKKSCVVNGIRPMASSTSAYLEVSCSDGEPGFMIKYPRAGNEPSDVFTCGDAKGISGGCTLPTNKLS